MRRTTWLWLLAAAGLMVAAQGCASFDNYLLHRYEDLMETVDIGLTVTPTPQVGLYANCFEILPLGYSNIDGHFIGWGGNQIGITRHYDYCWGCLFGEEVIGWGKELDDPDKREGVLIKRRAGIVGIALGVDLTGHGYGYPPSYSPACVHFLPHIAYVGLVWNLRYAEIADFALGWFGLDIAGDDGYAVGKWSFPRRTE